ncbi:MAG: NIPSNAP family protein [Verrucomicrobiota bacterium]|nr:NIPSNAP family protein [Verrucomicrobiota bacterium]
MNKVLLLLISVISTFSLMAADTGARDTRLFERRTYYATPGKLDDLHARFRNHTVRLFKKHGMESIGYWIPVDNKENKLVFILAYPNREAREKSWKAFLDDPDWKKAAKESEANGPILYGEKIESIFLEPVDYSPEIKLSTRGNRVFEFRTYEAAPGKLDDLNARFRNHTVNLFAKHGMENIAYWVKAKGEKDADKILFYIISHASPDAAKKSFDDFRKDPDWNSAKTASEKNGSLTAPNGVKSEFYLPTDYSPMR